MRKKIIVGGLVVVALLALVAGATYAIFSYNVHSDIQTFGAGTVKITVNDDPDQEFDTTLGMTNMEPGDCSTQPITVTNTGSLPVFLWNWIYPGGDIFNCDPNPSCNMFVKKALTADSQGPEENIEVGGWEKYDLTACLPLCAGNLCQGDTGTFQMFFHAVQQSHLEGYECVKLEDKEAPDWLPDPTTPQHGNLCYKVVDGDLHIIVNGYELTANACFQLALDGGDMNDPNDGACTTQDDNLAKMSSNVYISGYWNWGTYLEATCNSTNGGEGVYNYAGVYEADKVCADSGGNFSWGGTITGLPSGNYIVKANVKEITNPWPGTKWTGVLSGLDYLSFTIP